MDSPPGEFLLVNAVCFALPLSSSIWIVLRHVRTMEMSDARVWRGVAIELLSIAAALAVLRVRGWKRDSFGFHATVGNTLGGVLLTIGYMVGVGLFYWLLSGLLAAARVDASRLEFVHFHVTAHLPVMLLFIVINSFYEELFVTGYAIESLQEHGPAYAVTVSAFIRFAYHIYQGPLAASIILLLGVAFATLYWRGRNLYSLWWPTRNLLVFARSH